MATLHTKTYYNRRNQFIKILTRFGWNIQAINMHYPYISGENTPEREQKRLQQLHDMQVVANQQVNLFDR